MKRSSSRFVWRVFAAVGIVLALTPTATPKPKGKSPLHPAHANFRGRSVEEWNTLAIIWRVANGLGGQSLPDTIDKVRFIGGAFAPGEYEFDVSVPTGTALAFPAFFVFGELYDNGASDNPEDPILDEIFETTTVEMRLDGQVIRSGLASDLDAFGPVVLDEPIFYEEPQPRGPDLNAVAATFVLGTANLFHPLPPGQHTLETTVTSAFFGEFHYTHHIEVTRGKK
jgi:hypothetical protein